MTQGPRPERKFGPREYVGGFAFMALAFGAYAWVKGRDIPWGYQQTYGAVLIGLGIVCALVSLLWPRKGGG